MVVKPFIIGDYKQIKSSAEIHDLSASAKDSVSLFKQYGRSQSVEVDVEAAFDGSASAETDTRTMEWSSFGGCDESNYVISGAAVNGPRDRGQRLAVIRWRIVMVL